MDMGERNVSEVIDAYSKRNIASNVIWRILERVLSQAITIIVSIILLRILSPSDYGQVAIVTVFTTILTVFLTSGLGDSLIQKKDADSLDFSSLFWLNLMLGILIYIAMYLAAPAIADFYGYVTLTPLIRVLSLRLIVTSVNTIQLAYISRNMLFRRESAFDVRANTTSPLTGRSKR